MERQVLKHLAMLARKALCAAAAVAMLSACGGGGGGASAPDPSQYTGPAARASINTANAVAFTTDAFAAGSIGSSTNVVDVVASKAVDGTTITLPELAAQLQGSVARGLAQKAKAARALAGATSSTIHGAVAGSASMMLDLQTTGDFTGKVTLDKFQETAGGPTISGTVTVTGHYNEITGRYDSMALVCSPLSATTSTGTTNVYGSFVFSNEGTNEVLKLSCTLNSSGKTYWIKDWTYTFSPDNFMTITGVYYHPSYGYAEITTPTRLTVSSLSGSPTAGVFQAAGAHCSKARLTFSATGSLVTAIGGDNQNLEVCSD